MAACAFLSRAVAHPLWSLLALKLPSQEQRHATELLHCEPHSSVMVLICVAHVHDQVMMNSELPALPFLRHGAGIPF